VKEEAKQRQIRKPMRLYVLTLAQQNAQGRVGDEMFQIQGVSYGITIDKAKKSPMKRTRV